MHAMVKAKLFWQGISTFSSPLTLSGQAALQAKVGSCGLELRTLLLQAQHSHWEGTDYTCLTAVAAADRHTSVALTEAAAASRKAAIELAKASMSSAPSPSPARRCAVSISVSAFLRPARSSAMLCLMADTCARQAP